MRQQKVFVSKSITHRREDKPVTVQEVNGNRERDTHTQRKPTNNEVVESYKVTYHLADEEDDTHGCPYGTKGWA